ncbi:MAG TPA: sulfatase-like hydrolase/transferase, partial [Rhodanobacteraceae bacterium]|nr:sulfatase-like hydrolase/transferase [Rhodanobacteraceae bacterium]
RSGIAVAFAMVLLAVPAIGVRVWMAAAFPSYLHGQFGQDVVFALAWCALLVSAVRWRLLGIFSVPAAWLAYLAWLFLVLGEGVSYYLQADTFNARFFAHLNPGNLHTGLRAFPAMIGGGTALFLAMLLASVALLAWMARHGRLHAANARSGPSVITLVILMLIVLGVDSAPRRLIDYLVRTQQAAHFADTPQGRAVAGLLDLHPVSKKKVIAAPGKNVVWIYMESLERIYWDPAMFPGLMPNLDRLRKQGLDFSGFETFAGANYTMAGLFASQCGIPLFTSAFAGLDTVAGNTTDASTFHPKIACFGDVLHKAGYSQVYMGGAPIVFSNNGLFFRMHGYDEALGLQQLEAEAGGKLPESGWGLYDSVLFKLALARYQKLAAARRPFNLTLLTLDTHPPDGRPSPGCPKYAASSNSMLQAVHCTDYLLGNFIDALSKQPDWKNTVVVIMSDHLMMRNDAESLFPKNYHRQPALLILNAGGGVRRTRMYHMDIAPTVLDVMGVRTNATFIAGSDRHASDAGGSELMDDAVTDAVLRKALWSRVNEFKLCKKNTLLGWTTDGGFDVGGRELKMSYRGRAQVGLRDDQVLDFFIDNANAKLVIADAGAQPRLLKDRGDASVLAIKPVTEVPGRGSLFTIDWLGRNGAKAHLGRIDALRGLTITSPQCGSLVQQVDEAPLGAKLDLSRDFNVVSAVPPELEAGTEIDFTRPESAVYGAGLGWLPPQGWGSWAIGRTAVLAFRMPGEQCRAGGKLHMRVDPYLSPTRPDLDTQVWVNGQLATTWHFASHGKFSTDPKDASDSHDVFEVEAPIDANDACEATIKLRFARPRASQGAYPKSEDPRPLQLRVLGMRLTSATEES